MHVRLGWALVPALLVACTRPGGTPTAADGAAATPNATTADSATRSSGTTADAVRGRERIVYSSLRPGNWDIYYFASAGAEPQRLTDHPGLDYDAVFSPDGRWVVFTSERRGNPDLYAIDLASSRNGGMPSAHLLIDSGAMEDQAAFAPDGGSLAFVSTASGNADVYMIPFSPDRTQNLEAARNLTSHSGGDFRPDFSPDGERIAFTSDRDTPVYGHPIFSFTRQREGEIYVMSRDGTDARRLTTSVDWDGSPEWSADGRTIYFYSGRPRELPGPPQSPILGQEGGFRIWAMGADGSDPRVVTPQGVEALAPALMPGGRIAYQTRSGFADWSIASVEASGAGAPRAETRGASYWLPDYDKTGAMVCHGVGPTTAATQAVEEILGAGALLAADYPAAAELPDRTVALYPLRHTSGLAPRPDSDETAVTIENEAGSRLVLADFDGGNERELLSVAGVGIVSGTPNRIFDIKWSPDGSWLTYTQGFFAGQGTDEADIWVMRADGSERRNLTADLMGNEGVAAFSPDSSRLVFRSSRAGNVDLFAMDRDGGRVTQLTNDAARENFPVFSPSGDAIAFSSNRDGVVDRFGNRTFDNYVMALESDGSAGDVRRISNDPGQDSHPWYSPDGKWIVFTSERGGLSDEEPMVQEVVFGPQMYGEIYAYRLEDGTTIRLTHNKWEEGNPFWVRAPR
jgi:Tol biopolymer transport system component